MTERLDPYNPPRPTVEALQQLSPAEGDKLIADMRDEWARTRHVELARQDARRAHVAAGGDGEAFDRQWSDTGQAEYIQRAAAEQQERARRESSIF